MPYRPYALCAFVNTFKAVHGMGIAKSEVSRDLLLYDTKVHGSPKSPEVVTS